MLKQFIAIVIFLGVLSTASFGRTNEERAAEIVAAAQGYVDSFGSAQDNETLARAYNRIEETWRDLTKYVNPNHPVKPDFALMRARAATAAGVKKHIVEAWHTAIQLKGPLVSPQQLVPLNLQAAHAAAAAKDFVSAQQFFSAARAYAFARGENADISRLYMRIEELNVLGEGMPWRNLRDALLDLRDFSETFAMWTIPRLEAVVAETEIRLKFQPEGEEKRENLSTLKAEITLIVDGVAGSLPVGFMSRVRELNYALEDHYQL